MTRAVLAVAVAALPLLAGQARAADIPGGPNMSCAVWNAQDIATDAGAKAAQKEAANWVNGFHTAAALASGAPARQIITQSIIAWSALNRWCEDHPKADILDMVRPDLQILAPRATELAKFTP